MTSSPVLEEGGPPGTGTRLRGRRPNGEPSLCGGMVCQRVVEGAEQVGLAEAAFAHESYRAALTRSCGRSMPIRSVVG